MARGGKRTGTPGTSYSNRTDLNQAPSGDTYGDKKQMQDRIDAVPLQPAPRPQGQPQAQPQPLQAPGALTRPTERPMEPVTAGLGQMGSDPLDEVRAIYHAFPNDDLRELLEYWESQ